MYTCKRAVFKDTVVDAARNVDDRNPVELAAAISENDPVKISHVVKMGVDLTKLDNKQLTSVDGDDSAVAIVKRNQVALADEAWKVAAAKLAEAKELFRVGGYTEYVYA